MDEIEAVEEFWTVDPPAEIAAGNSFTALLELPATQAVKLLHSPVNLFSGDVKVEQAFNFSESVKNEPETDSNLYESSPLIYDPTVQNKAAKRKEREKKVKLSNKRSKSSGNDSSGDAEKLPYVHVRARRGQATDSHSLAERARREKINARMKLLQELVPGCSKISGTALVLDEIINHVQSLQHQVELLSMRLAAVNPRVDFNLDSLLAVQSQSGSLMGSNFPGLFTPMNWPEVQAIENGQQEQQSWQYDVYHQQAVWEVEENHNFVTPENSLLSYNSSANSASLLSNQLKMEL